MGVLGGLLPGWGGGVFGLGRGGVCKQARFHHGEEARAREGHRGSKNAYPVVTHIYHM